MTYDELNVPWHTLPEHVKEWCRNNGYVLRESGNGSTVLAEWREQYLKQHTHE